MAYAGNFMFNDWDDFMRGCDNTARCACCGKLYTPGYMASEGDGFVPGGIHEFWVEGERDCPCTDQDLRLALEAKDEDIFLDKHGKFLLQRLIEVPDLRHIDEYDICRISEAAGKTFMQLADYFLDNLILWHVYAWAKHMRKKWGPDSPE